MPLLNEAPLEIKQCVTKKTNDSDIEIIISSLVKAHGSFSAKELADAMDIPIDEAEALVQKMLDSGIIFESADGKFRAA